MRASMHGQKDCRDYDAADTFDTTVYLDGVRQDMCIVADEEAGYVVRYCKSYPPPDGPLWEPPTEVMHGRVKICLPVNSATWTGRL